MKPSWVRGLPWVAVASVLTVVFGSLLLPGEVFVGRDVPLLHLPLRLDFQRLLADGLPAWNPWLHGGQPILSNPHYAPWYPTTWLILLLPVHRALQVSIVLHALWAFAGAYRLARHLGCGRGAATLAATAFAGGGPLVALANTTLMFFGFAWLPWILLAADRAFRLTHGSGGVGSVLLCALGMALQILNGDPTAVIFTTILLILLAASAAFRAAAVARWLPWRRLAALLALALALASAQVVPTWFRLRDSVRSSGLTLDRAAVWSTQPERLVELVAPHFFGDPTRDEEDLYFGWRLNDKEYPFLLSIAPGLLVLTLGVAALASRATPRRWVWLAAAAGGLFLGLGRHNPIFSLLHATVPFLSMVRYPEKFLLLPLLCLPFAAGLGWQELVDSRRRGGKRAVPVAVAAAVVLVASALLVVVWWPGASEAMVRGQSAVVPTPRLLAKGSDYLRREALVVIANGVLVLSCVLLCRRLKTPAAVLSAGALVLVLADLGYYGRRLLPMASGAEFFRPPPVVAGLRPGDRIFTDLPFRDPHASGPRIGEPGTIQLSARLAWVDPYTGNLWGLGHVLHEDFDLMLTGWARHSLAALHHDWPDRELALRLVGAWNAGTLLRARSPREMLPELRAGKSPELTALERNPALIPRWRSVPEAVFHADSAAALAAARQARYSLGASEHLVGASTGLDDTVQFATVRVLAARETGRDISLRLAPGGASLLVAAVTFDTGWSAATGEGAALRLWPTAIGQIAVAVPAGCDAVVLRYRDPWVAVGASLSVIGFLSGALVWRRTRPALAPNT